MAGLSERSRIRVAWLLGTALAFSIAVEFWPHPSTVPAVQAQGGTRTLIIDRLYRTDPIEIVKVLSAGNEAEVNTRAEDDTRGFVLIYDGGHYPARGGAVGALACKFQSDDNWLSALSFVLRNRTSKTIVLVAITVISPLRAPPRPGPPYVEWEGRFTFGQLPAILAHTRAGIQLPTTTKKTIRFGPGQEITLALADGVAVPRSLAARAHPLSDTILCRVRTRVAFEDGLQWFDGDYYKPDPERPGESVLMGEEYFPGSLMGTR
ncbi:MAG TPA: hypothetical protein VEO19_15960 [Terriglobia bacterium]|nr:hypothetical protein [Terriglobia bacterium]